MEKNVHFDTENIHKFKLESLHKKATPDSKIRARNATRQISVHLMNVSKRRGGERCGDWERDILGGVVMLTNIGATA